MAKKANNKTQMKNKMEKQMKNKNNSTQLNDKMEDNNCSNESNNCDNNR